jgi:glycolate oxidase iron-sulfur subunit
VQSVLDPAINAATIRLVTRLGYEVVVAGEEACCGSITLHMGRTADAEARARRSIEQWERAEVDHVLITASGCGTTIKDYGHLLRLDKAYAARASAIAAKALDISEFLVGQNLPPARAETATMRVAYHSPCSMQHGQKIRSEPQALLRQAGFTVLEIPEGHLCCGSAGTYNILQPALAQALKARKTRNIRAVSPQLVATGNIGCITQLQDAMGIPVLHTIQLLDWAHGGPRPTSLPEPGHDL